LHAIKTAEPSLHPASRYFDRVELQRLGDERPAGLWIASLPVPPGVETGISLGGQPTYVQPLGEWPGHEGSPRRLLLIADGGESAPSYLRPEDPVAPAGALPEAEMTLLERSPDFFYLWEAHGLTLRWGEQAVRLAMGLRVGEEVHWWENCRLVVEEETPSCRIVSMGGAIPHQKVTREHYQQYRGYKDPFLHRHNWVYGYLYVRLHANGVCEVFARHTNSKCFDDGLELHGAVPVISMKVEGAEPELAALQDLPTGGQSEFSLGAVRFDVHDIAHLATPEKPGKVKARDGALVWQPYLGMELFGGRAPEDVSGDPYIVKAEDQRIPRGMGRTLRFTLSLNPDRSPGVARYQAPAWWYGLCEEFSPRPLLPVCNAYDEMLEYQRQWIRHTIHRGGFEDGCEPRSARTGKAERPEPGWEGETPGAMFLCAYRTGDAIDHDLALRAAYTYTDVYIDHAVKLVRMHGQETPAVALPMARVHACVYAYLETGDPYLLDTAQAVIDTSYRLHKNAWPRLSVGRDACFIRGAMLLYRYCNDRHFLDIARDSIRTVAASQFDDGSFGDQGGGTGTHGKNSYIIKPWMGLMAVGGALDYLEMFPEDEAAWTPVRKFADWLMRERRMLDGGVHGWSYQHGYAGRREYIQSNVSDTVIALPSPGLWHREYLARLLTLCSLRTGDPAYFDAWAESYAGHATRLEREGYTSGDHAYAQCWQYLPWLQQRLWGATAGSDGLELHPVHFGPRTPAEARILTPDGIERVRWVDEEHWEIDE
jgi:hypothetical protein